MLHDHFEDILDRIGAVGYILIAMEFVVLIAFSPAILFGAIAKALVDAFTKTEVGTIEIKYLEPKVVHNEFHNFKSKQVMPTREQFDNIRNKTLSHGFCVGDIVINKHHDRALQYRVCGETSGGHILVCRVDNEPLWMVNDVKVYYDGFRADVLSIVQHPKQVMPTKEQLSNAAERKHWLSLLRAGELPSTGQIRLYVLLGFGRNDE